MPGPREAADAAGTRPLLARVQPRPRRGDHLTPQGARPNEARGRDRRLGGLYLVTAPVRPFDRLASIVSAAIEGGASLVQLREKAAPSDEKTAAAKAVQAVCRSHGVPFLVNDEPEFARRVDADGVHVGREDPSPRIARTMLGPRALIGVTVYGKAGEEDAARAAGADYLGVGPFFPSPTKPEEPVLPLHVLDQVVHRARLPVFAIGGIVSGNAGIMARHGAAGVAVVSAIVESPDPRSASESILGAFRGGRTSAAGDAAMRRHMGT